MSNLNLHLERTRIENDRILCYSVSSLNNTVLKDWAHDIIIQLNAWPDGYPPLLLFDLSNPNVSMSYFVLTSRNIFNLALTPETREPLDTYIMANPAMRVRLALILSQTMAGVMSSNRGTNVLRQLTTGKVFFAREPAVTWLLADTSYEPDAGTRHIDVDQALNELEMDGIQGEVFSNKGELRLLVNGSLEIVPISEVRPIIIGRSNQADIDVTSHGQPATTVSRQHAQISLTNGELTIMDLNSKNGTYVTEQRLDPGKPVRINHTMELRVGVITVRVLS